MASNILIKRSTGSVAPGTITFGELAVTTGANGTQDYVVKKGVNKDTIATTRQ